MASSSTSDVPQSKYAKKIAERRQGTRPEFDFVDRPVPAPKPKIKVEGHIAYFRRDGSAVVEVADGKKFHLPKEFIPLHVEVAVKQRVVFSPAKSRPANPHHFPLAYDPEF